MVRWCLLGILLAGCQSAPPPPSAVATPVTVAVSPVASVTPTVVASATPVATSTPAEVGTDLNGAVRATAQFVHLGMTNQARCDQLVAHLNAVGKNQLWVTWEVYPAAAGVFEVTYAIEPLSNLTSGKKPTVGKRGSPFDRPRRVHNNGVYLEWLYDANKKILRCAQRQDPGLDGDQAGPGRSGGGPASRLADGGGQSGHGGGVRSGGVADGGPFGGDRLFRAGAVHRFYGRRGVTAGRVDAGRRDLCGGTGR